MEFDFKMKLLLNHYNHRSDIVKAYREEVIEDIKSSGQNEYLLFWYGDNWDRQPYMCADVITDDNGNLVYLGATELSDDGDRVKVVIRQYVMKKQRHHHSLNQRILIPKAAEIAKVLGATKLWMTAHAFDERRERWIQTLYNKKSTTPRKDMPYYDAWEPEGKILYKGVEQHSWIINL